jgi:hypothetical protein
VPDLSGLYPLLAAPVGVVLVIVLAILVSLVICLRGTKPTERPEIIRALADLFQSFRRLKRSDIPDDRGTLKQIDSPLTVTPPVNCLNSENSSTERKPHASG